MAVPEIDAGRFGKGGQLLRVHGQGEGLVPIGLDPFPGQGDGRRQDVGPVHAAVPLERQGQTCHRTRDRHGPMAENVGVVRDPAPREQIRGDSLGERIDRLVARRRRLDVEVERHRLSTLGQVDQHGPATCDRGHEGLCDRHGEGGGDGGVYGVAAAYQHGGPHFGPQSMGGDDHTARGEGGALRRDGRGIDHAICLRSDSFWVPG